MGKAAKIALFGTLGMVAGIAALQSLGQNLEQEFAAENANRDVAAAASESAQMAAEAAVDAAAASAAVFPATEAPRVGSTMLEQAIFDAFPLNPPKSRSAKKTAANAADFVAASINAQGYLCARPIEMQKAADGQYGVGCITHREGYGRSNYLVDVRSGRVAEI